MIGSVLCGSRGASVQSGLVVVDKPGGWTSHDVVAKLRSVYGQRRIGHAGTLDPDATGVLLVGVGHATRLLTFLVGHDKRYTGEIVLGTETDTLDSSGRVTAVHDMSAVTLDEARNYRLAKLRKPATPTGVQAN